MRWSPAISRRTSWPSATPPASSGSCEPLRPHPAPFRDGSQVTAEPHRPPPRCGDTARGIDQGVDDQRTPSGFVLRRGREDTGAERDSVAHLTQVARHPGVGLQILPLDASLPFEQLPPFTVLTSTDEPPVDVVWLEHMTGASLLERRDDIDRYIDTWNDLTAAALSPGTSLRLLGEVMEGIA
ncbi:Scr1 family TA system antitoxin-like transcriptional regulator [Streptomyces sp. ST2-7A]|uniref:Scr1 family TA system antitoxin-like transcriptional regulator n=1 Tax=Streptomyces sp. ST2-7A TaxID=2907214 RepID=UPI001F26625A|nr:Scr1 family TA system antitoxin-like transcriptional regulator [Streptomyces sp. ST2-7A]MCE7082276.1 DUF5753 domain-containing protein [Streptomyces sp. ST2-7A]